MQDVGTVYIELKIQEWKDLCKVGIQWILFPLPWVPRLQRLLDTHLLYSFFSGLKLRNEIMFRNSFQGIKYLDIFNSKVKIYDGVSTAGLYINLQNVLDIFLL